MKQPKPLTVDDWEFAQARETQSDVAMWGVWACVEGDDPQLLALFTCRSDAEAYANATDDDGDQAICDPGIEPAIVEVSCVNHYAVETHSEVRRAIALNPPAEDAGSEAE